MSPDTPRIEQPTLTGKTVELQPLQYGHAAQLVAAAADGELWNLKVTVVPDQDNIDQYIEKALTGRQNGTVMPFVIVRRDTGQVVGTTRFWKIDRDHRKMEIGSTWLAASAQRTGINTEAKYLLLTYAFETMMAVRVQFTTDEGNAKSRAAILGVGATQEGIVRNERIMPDGRKRNSVRFSIIDTEWPDVKAMLEKKMAR